MSNVELVSSMERNSYCGSSVNNSSSPRLTSQVDPSNYNLERLYVQEIFSKIKNKNQPDLSDLTILFDRLTSLAYQDVHSTKKIKFDYFYMFFNIMLDSPILSVTESTGNRVLHLLLLKKLNGLLFSNVLIQNYCHNEKWVYKLLNYLISRSKHDSDVIGELSITLQIICSFNITTKELKYFFKLLESINEERPYYWNVLIEILQFLFRKRVGPDIYFNFSNSNGGLMIPDKQPFDGGYSISFWMNTDDFTSLRYRPGLFSFFSDENVGFEVTFQQQSLIFQIRTKSKSPCIGSHYRFQPGKWYHVIISHEYFLLRKSQLSLYVNGKLEEKMPLLYPKSDRAFTRCHIGNSISLQNGFLGRIGSILMIKDALEPAEATLLYQIDKNSTMLQEKLPKEGMTAIYDGQLFLASGRRNIPIIFTYHPRATDKALCFEISSGELPNAATIMDGVSILKSVSPLDQLVYIGGLKMIYPLFAQLGQPINGVEIEMPQDISDHMTTSPLPLSNLNDFISIPSSSGPTPIFPSSIGSGHSSCLFKILLSLLQHHPAFREQIIETHGFQVISFLLKSTPTSSPYWTPDDIDSLSRLISFCAGKQPLWSLAIQHLIMNNFQLWSQTNSLTQIALFETIHQRIQTNPQFWRNLVRVDQWLTILRKFYQLPPSVSTSSPLSSPLSLSSSTSPITNSGSWCKESIEKPIFKDLPTIEKIKKARVQIIVIIRETAQPRLSPSETRWLSLYLKESTIENHDDVIRMLEDIIQPLQSKDTWWDDVMASANLQDENLVLKSRKDFQLTQTKLPSHISYLWDIDCCEEVVKRLEEIKHQDRSNLILFKHWVHIRRVRAGNLNGIKTRLINGNSTNTPILTKLKQMGIIQSPSTSLSTSSITPPPPNSRNTSTGILKNSSIKEKQLFQSNIDTLSFSLKESKNLDSTITTTTTTTTVTSTTTSTPTNIGNDSPQSIESPISSPVLINNTATTTSSPTLSIKDNYGDDNDDGDEPEDTTVVHWKLDRTEGPLRMRRKLKRNYFGSDYKGLSKQNRFGRSRRTTLEKFSNEIETFYIDQDCGDGLGNIIITIVNEPPLPIQTTAYKEIEFLNESQLLSSSSNIDNLNPNTGLPYNKSANNLANVNNNVNNNNNNNSNSNINISGNNTIGPSSGKSPLRNSRSMSIGSSATKSPSRQNVRDIFNLDGNNNGNNNNNFNNNNNNYNSNSNNNNYNNNINSNVYNNNSNNNNNNNLSPTLNSILPNLNNISINSGSNTIGPNSSMSSILSPRIGEFDDNGDVSSPNSGSSNNTQMEEEKFIGSWRCQMVVPVGVIPGQFTITSHHLTFDKDIPIVDQRTGRTLSSNGGGGGGGGGVGQDQDFGSVKIKNTYIWKVKDLVEIHRVRYLLRWNSIEIFLNHKSYMINFSKEQESIQIFNKIVGLHPPNLRVKWSDHPSKIIKKSKLTMKWKNREISNFEYLMSLNTIAGRTYNDISQYPVFPQIISDYRSEFLDLNDSRSFRDLSKPVGALNQQRLDTLIKRYQSMQSAQDPTMPPFLYGSHYSNFGIVAYYQVRLEPFTSFHLSLQSGVFDHPQRMFESMDKMWDGVSGNNLADVKELIPEFFYMPEFINNSEGFNFGFTNSKSGDLILPTWAHQSPELFIQINREALESEYVSMNLHHWIDLIFGYKQNGPAAQEANNVFFHLTYENNAALQRDDPEERQSIASQIKEFGQTPPQLFSKPHPVRKTLQEISKPQKDLFARIAQNLFSPSNSSSNNNGSGGTLNSSPSTLNSPQGPSLQYPFKVLKTKSSLPLVHISSCQDSDIVVLVYRDGVMAVNQFVPSPSGNLPFTFDIDKTLSTYKEKQIDTLFMSDSVTCISNCFAITPDGKFMFSCATWDSVFKCSNIQNGRVHRLYRDFHHDMVTCISLGSNGKHFATASSDTTILVWNDVDQLIKDSKAKPSYRLCSHDEPVHCLDINEEWDLIASGSMDKKLILHSLGKGHYQRSMIHNGAVEIVKISTVGQTIISYCSMSFLYVHSFNGKLLKIQQSDEKIYDAKLTGESVKKGGVLGVGSSTQYLVTGGTRGVKVRSLPDLNIVHAFDSPAAIKTIELVAHEKYMLIGLNDGNLVIIPFDVKDL
ncbi:hypothetical protein ACTFIU_000067 [Dictyostelium citrinum]